jgi:hypothetical protein
MQSKSCYSTSYNFCFATQPPDSTKFWLFKLLYSGKKMLSIILKRYRNQFEIASENFLKIPMFINIENEHSSKTRIILKLMQM